MMCASALLVEETTRHTHVILSKVSLPEIIDTFDGINTLILRDSHQSRLRVAWEKGR
jgi:hypothetical protein